MVTPQKVLSLWYDDAGNMISTPEAMARDIDIMLEAMMKHSVRQTRATIKASLTALIDDDTTHAYDLFAYIQNL